jgi:hypothetical protein
VPWCEDCAKYWAPSAMREDGTCPTCGRSLEAPAVPSTSTTPSTPITAKNLDLRKLAARSDDESESAPWHFKLLMVLLVLYLGWRLVDLFL